MPYYQATAECLEWLERNSHIEPGDLIMAWSAAYSQAMADWEKPDFICPDGLLAMTELLIMWHEKYGPLGEAERKRDFGNLLRARMNPKSWVSQASTNSLPEMENRDRWCYIEALQGKPWDRLRLESNDRFPDDPFDSIQALKNAVNRYADRWNLQRPPTRKRGRPSKHGR